MALLDPAAAGDRIWWTGRDARTLGLQETGADIQPLPGTAIDQHVATKMRVRALPIASWTEALSDVIVSFFPMSCPAPLQLYAIEAEPMLASMQIDRETCLFVHPSGNIPEHEDRRGSKRGVSQAQGAQPPCTPRLLHAAVALCPPGNGEAVALALSCSSLATIAATVAAYSASPARSCSSCGSAVML